MIKASEKQSLIKMLQGAGGNDIHFSTIESLKPETIKQALTETEKFIRAKSADYVIVALRK